MKKGFLLIESALSLLIISIISIIVLALFARTIIMFKEVMNMNFNRINVENSIINIFRFFRDDIDVSTVKFNDAGYKKYFEFKRKNNEKLQIEKSNNYLKMIFIDQYNKRTYEYLYTGKSIDIDMKENKMMEFQLENYKLNICSEEW
jgi:competence protein ComGC